MPASQRIRHYVSFQPQGELSDAYSRWQRQRSTERRHDIHRLADQRLRTGLQQLGLRGHVAHRLAAHPSLGWRLVLEGAPDIVGPETQHVWSVELDMAGSYETALDRLGRIRSGLAEHLPDCEDLAMSADLPVFSAEYWNPAESASQLFGDRAAARRLLGLEGLRNHAGCTGKGVNVVVVDQGLDKTLIRRLGGTYGGGWEYLRDPASGATIVPGETKGGHGAMMVRNILDIAPEVTIFDCPLLPPRIINIRRFLSRADAAYARMLADIRFLRDRDARWRGPWIFVNAWAIYDRQSEHPAGDYTDNPQHRFNRLMSQAVEDGCDVVFCAGNCGQFCPAQRCGALDRGPRNSIFGANSHPAVLTVGAVRVDGLWLGYSSQGPGQPRLAHEKPDLCGPSQFAETQDAGIGNTGSSAASALAAGVVAAMRSRWDAKALPPEGLKQVLIASARRADGADWNGQRGYGIINAGAACRDATLATSPPRTTSAPE